MMDLKCEKVTFDSWFLILLALFFERPDVPLDLFSFDLYQNKLNESQCVINIQR